MPVPDGIAPEDAIYLPAVETAIPIAHDAHPRAGERVAVFGCGLIGLLVMRVLHGLCVDVTGFDPNEQRRELAIAECGASAGGTDDKKASFDIAIEVSGSTKALQSAIDSVRGGGKVVIASWYSDNISLMLGTRFHRSHISIISSQVSTLPAAVSATWTKQRRFKAAWDIIRKCKPSRFLTTMKVSTANAQKHLTLYTRARQ